MNDLTPKQRYQTAWSLYRRLNSMDAVGYRLYNLADDHQASYFMRQALLQAANHASNEEHAAWEAFYNHTHSEIVGAVLNAKWTSPDCYSNGGWLRTRSENTYWRWKAMQLAKIQDIPF